MIASLLLFRHARTVRAGLSSRRTVPPGTLGAAGFPRLEQEARPAKRIAQEWINRRRVRVSKRTKIIAGVAAGVIVVGGVALLTIFKDLGKNIPLIGDIVEESVCPLNGAEPNKDEVDRPAVAIKVENAQEAYPLSGLDGAELVYEELVEGGVTRFMAMYHCNDSNKIGPVRSARSVDPGIMVPVTKILTFSGANGPVRDVLDKAGIFLVEEGEAEGVFTRVERPGLGSEHTLYANSARARTFGAKKYEDPPPDTVFKFGDLEGDTKRAKTIDISFSDLTNIRYEYSGGGYKRFQPTEQAFEIEESGQLEVENVLIEEHVVNNSKTIKDVNGNPSTEIADETGSGRAVLFRDGQAIEGKWLRESLDDLVRFETAAGNEMVFSEGNVWIHLLPGKKGELEGSFSFE